MIVDSSALIAVLLREPEWEDLFDHLSEADYVGVGAPTLVESGIVLTARAGLAGKTMLARMVQEGDFEIVPLTHEHWSVAVDAYVRFGKGRHPAALNFGDCLTYAVSRIADEPLLFVGDDFTETDLEVVGAEV